MFKYIASFLSLVVTTIILQTDTYASSCNPDCGIGFFCDTVTNPVSFCNTCNKPDGATFIGVGSDNAPDSCQWEISCSAQTITCDGVNCGSHQPDTSTITGYGENANGEYSCSYTTFEKITCNAGYYRVKENAFTSNPGTRCIKCPYGSTSAANDNKARNKCYFAQSTIITDNTNGSYTTPSNKKMYIVGD